MTHVRVEVESNGFGTAGFIVSVLSLFLCGLTSPLGLLMSLVGLLFRPRGMAAAGVVLGLLGSWWLFAFGLVMMMGIVGAALEKQNTNHPPSAASESTETAVNPEIN